MTPETAHTTHEPLDIAALAAGDLEGDARVQAERRIATCVDCRALHDDLLAIARSVRSHPPAIPDRPRDFTLTPQDAARLRSPWHRALGWLAGPRGAVTRPLATGIATLGVVAMLVSAMPMSLGGAASAPAEFGAQDTASTAGAEASAAAPEVAPLAKPSPAVGGPDASLGVQAPVAEGGQPSQIDTRNATPDDGARAAERLSDGAALEPLAVLGIALLGIALIVVVSRPIARRIA